jgi:hypothetical protein
MQQGLALWRFAVKLAWGSPVETVHCHRRARPRRLLPTAFPTKNGTNSQPTKWLANLANLKARLDFTVCMQNLVTDIG